jgi:hypothetical protein
MVDSLAIEETGTGRWYEKHLSKAEKLFTAYLKETGQTD